MNTLVKVVSAVFFTLAMMTSQVFAAGSLYPLDAWDHPIEGHMSSEAFDTETSVDDGMTR